MKRFIQCVSLIVVAVIIFAIPVSAAEPVTPKASYYFTASSTYLWKESSTTFQVWFDITATGGMDELGASAITVQKSTDGVNWTTMYTYTKELYPHLIAKNTGTHDGYVTYTGTPGCRYRALVTYYAKNSRGTGEVFEYTSSIVL